MRTQVKRLIYLAAIPVILFNVFYFDYKKASAVEFAYVTLETAFMYLSGLVGVSPSIDLTDQQKSDIINNVTSFDPVEFQKKIQQQSMARIVDMFYAQCKAKNIAQDEIDKFVKNLTAKSKGVVDTTSECWKAFLDVISSSHPVERSIFGEGSTLGFLVYLTSLKQEFTHSGNTYTCSLADPLAYNAVKETLQDKFPEILSSENLYVISSTQGTNGSTGYPFFNIFTNVSATQSYPDINDSIKEYGLFTNSSGSYSNQVMYQYKVGNTIKYSALDYIRVQLTLVPEFNASGNIKSYSVRYSESRINANSSTSPLVTSRKMTTLKQVYDIATNEYVDMANTAEFPTLTAMPKLIGNVFDGASKMSDNMTLINSNATTMDGSITLPWDNVTSFPAYDDATGAVARPMSDDIAELWAKLAAGAITWEEFCLALQRAIGITAFEQVIDDDLPIDKELVSEDDQPRPLPVVIETNVENSKFTYALKDFFPFCIPFDLYHVIEILNADPVAPKFDIPIPSYTASGTLTSNYITVDLSIFDTAALVFRVCIFLIFMVGLIVITRNLIRG